MKKVINILATALLIFTGFTSCDNDDDIVSVMPAKVTILSRETSFPASASSGKIVVDTDAPVSVSTSDTGWVTTSVDGNVITVNVEANTSFDGRSSTLTITSGDASSQIAIIQAGVIVDLHGVMSVLTGNDEATYSYDIKTNADPEISTDADWIKASIVDGKLNLKIEANNTGMFRKGSVTFTAGAYSNSIPVTQLDFDQDIAGNYVLGFIDASSGELSAFNTTLSRNGNTYTLSIPAYGFNIPVRFNDADVSLSLYAGSRIGTFQNFNIYTVFWDTDLGRITWGSSYSMDAQFYYDNSDGNSYLLADFVDNGSWTGYTSSAICLEAFSGTPSSTTDKGSLADMINPFLMRQISQPAAAAPAMLRARSASRSATPMPKLMPFETGSLSVLKDDSNVKVAY